MQLRLVRVAQLKGAMLGTLSFDGWPRMVTLEQDWEDNKTNISCIPAGTYTAIRHQSPKFGEVFMVENVTGRAAILIHAGNTQVDTHGCILVGCEYGELKNQPAVLRSQAALLLFKALLTGVDKATLTIVNAYDK